MCEIHLEILSANKRGAALQGGQDEQKGGRRMRFDKGVSCGIQRGAHDFRRHLREDRVVQQDVHMARGRRAQDKVTHEP